MFDLLQDLWGFMKERKKFWLMPIIFMLVLLGGLLVLAQGSAIAPFIYTLFWSRPHEGRDVALTDPQHHRLCRPPDPRPWSAPSRSSRRR